MVSFKFPMKSMFVLFALSWAAQINTYQTLLEIFGENLGGQAVFNGNSILISYSVPVQMLTITAPKKNKFVRQVPQRIHK